MTPDQLQQYINQYNTAMTPGGAAPGVANYQNTPGYQLQYGAAGQQNINNTQNGFNNTWKNNTTLQGLLQQPQLSLPDFLNSDAYKVKYGNNTSQDPNTRFQNDAGIQQAIAAGMPMLANSYGAKGLGASGAAAKGISQYMYNNYLNFTGDQGNMYDKQLNDKYQQQQQNVGTYLNQQGNYQNQQNQLGQNFLGYQNQLAGVANMGNQAVNQLSGQYQQSGQNLSSLLAQLYAGTGSGISGGYLEMGNNIASLLANLGVNQGNMYIGTGAGMSGNILAGSQLGAQLANAQNASNAQTQNSLMAGQGALAGANKLINLNTRGF